MATFETKTYSDDETHLNATNFLYAIQNMHESSKLFGKDMASSPTWKTRMEQVGFINVTEDIYVVCAVLPCWSYRSDSPKVTPKPMAEGPEAQGAWSVSSTQHDGSHSALHICIIHKDARLVTRRDRSFVSGYSERAAKYIPSPIHKGAGRIWSKARMIAMQHVSLEAYTPLNLLFVSEPS